MEVTEVLRARTTSGGECVIALSLNGIRKADGDLNLRCDGGPRKFLLDNNHPLSAKVKGLRYDEYLVLSDEECSGLFLP